MLGLGRTIEFDIIDDGTHGFIFELKAACDTDLVLELGQELRGLAQLLLCGLSTLTESFARHT